MVLDSSLPSFTATLTGFQLGETLATSGVTGAAACSAPTASATSPIGSYPINCAIGTLQASNYSFETYVPGTLSIRYATGGTCDGAAGHAILQPITASSVFKQGSTVPAKFRVCDANGVSIGPNGATGNGPTTKIVASFYMIGSTTGTVANVNEPVASTTPDTAFRWDSTNQQWIFNISTSNLSASTTYKYEITLNDGSTIDFQFGLK